MFRKIATELWRNEQFTNVAITHERRLHSKLTKLQQRVGTRLRYEQVEFGVTPLSKYGGCVDRNRRYNVTVR
jgi:hypothetical protein